MTFRRFLYLLIGLSLASAWAEDEGASEVERDPAATINSSKRTYPGGADEEDLRIQAQLPEAALKTDARSIQKDVYRNMFNQELKEERQEAVEE